MRICIFTLSTVFALTAMGLSPAFGQQGSKSPANTSATIRSGESADLAMIRAAADGFAAAFNKHDAKALATLWTEDGEYIDESGIRHAGREVIEKGFADFFSEHPDATMQIVIDSIRQLGDNAAIEDGRGIIEPPLPGAPGTGQYTAVHVKQDGKWLLASVRDFHVPTPSMHANLADFEWLIGAWAGEEHGAKSESICRWVANKSFIERTYKTTHADGSVNSGVQLIGWNPQEGNVQSWNFSSDGGHAVGIWTPTDGGWIAELHGILGDGTPTHAVNRLSRLDDNAYAWQSTDRSAGGTPLRDTDEVILKRQPANR